MAKKLFNDFCSYSLQLLWVFCVIMNIIILNVTTKCNFLIILINQTLLGHTSHGLSSALSLTIRSPWFMLACFVFLQSLKMLDSEETTDNELRTKFSQRWNRTPSGDLYKPLRAGTTKSCFFYVSVYLCVQVLTSSSISFIFFKFPTSPASSLPEGANFRSILDKAVQADQVVKDRYNTHCEMIALLCKPEKELSDAIPSANPMKTLQGSEVCLVACTFFYTVQKKTKHFSLFGVFCELRKQTPCIPVAQTLCAS